MQNINELKKELKALQESYNNYQSKMPDISLYTPPVQEEKREAYKKAGFEVYRGAFNDFISEINVFIKYKNKELNETKFPLLASESSDDKMLHEQKVMNARLFFGQFKDNPTMILNEVKKAIELDDLDYTNALLDIYFNVNLEPDQNMKEFRNKLYAEIGVNSLETDLIELEEMDYLAKGFIEALDKGALMLFSTEDYEDIEDEEFFKLREQIVDSFGEDEFYKIENNVITINARE